MSFQLISPAYAAVVSDWEAAGCATEGVATFKGLECLFKNIVNPIPGIIALIAVAMIIMAGIKLTTAGADAKAVESAWKTITFAVVGLVLLAGVWIALILIERFTGAPVTKFGVSIP